MRSRTSVTPPPGDSSLDAEEREQRRPRMLSRARTRAGAAARFARGFRNELSRAGHAWLALTDHEQVALALVLGLFLLGVAVRCWRTAAAG